MKMPRIRYNDYMIFPAIVVCLGIAIGIVIAIFSVEPKPEPKPKTRRAEEIGKDVGDKTKRFGAGFIDGWKNAKPKIGDQ